MVGTFESYISGIQIRYLQQIAKLIGIEKPNSHGKEKISLLIKDCLQNNKAKLRLFSRSKNKYYRDVAYDIQIIKQLENCLNIANDVSSELHNLWSDYKMSINENK